MALKRKRMDLSLFRPALLALAPVIPGMAMASDSGAAPVTASTCQQLADSVLKYGITQRSTVRVLPDGCFFTEVEVQKSTYQKHIVGELRVTGFQPWDRQTLPFPPHARVEASAIRFAPPIDDPRVHARYTPAAPSGTPSLLP